MKEENTITVILTEEIEFDGKVIFRISFDLEHINRGWNKNNNDYNSSLRSSYGVSDIVEFFEQFRYFNAEWDEESNKESIFIKGRAYYRYIGFVTDYENLVQKKIVIDIPKKFKNEAIVVTIF